MVIDSSDVSFSHLFPGSKTRTMQEKASYDVPISLDDADETDHYSQAMWAFDALRDATVARLLFPSRAINFTQQVEFDLTGFSNNVELIGYGARITTEGAISALRLSGSSGPQQLKIEGLTINHRNNGDAYAGIDISGAASVLVHKCTIIANDTDADWAGVLLNVDADSYWTVIDQLFVRPYDGGDPGRPAAGVRIEGSANATKIYRSQFSNCVDGVLMKPGPSPTYGVANAVRIIDCDFEQCIDGVHCDMNAASELSGLQIVHCRFENIEDHGLNLTGSTTQTMQTILPVYGPNFATGMASTLNNPNNLKVVDLTGLGGIGNFHLLSRGTPVIRNYSGAGFGLVLWAADQWQMLEFCDDAGAEIGGVHPNSVGGVKLHATNDRTLDIITARGISQTGTPANNLRGTVTLASGTATVSFATAEANTSYFIALSGNANETFRWGSKTTGGFTISSSNGSSTAVVDWHLIR